MAGENGAIWQVQLSAANGLEATAGAINTVLFNSSTKVPSDGAFGSETTVDFRRAVPENEGVDVDNNELQDMGISGLDITIEAVIGDADNDVAANSVNKLIKWLKDGNTLKTGSPIYSKGRYGLRLDNAPQWNAVPDNTPNTFGYHIRNIKFVYLGERVDLVGVTINLSLGGEIPNAI